MSLYAGDHLVCRFRWNSIQTCIPDGTEINIKIQKRIVHQVGYLQELYQDVRSATHKKKPQNYCPATVCPLRVTSHESGITSDDQWTDRDEVPNCNDMHTKAVFQENKTHKPKQDAPPASYFCISYSATSKTCLTETSNYAQKFLQAHTEFCLIRKEENGAKWFVASLINMGLYKQPTIAS